MNRLPGDIQIDAAISALGFDGPCLESLIQIKIMRWLAANA